MAASLQTSHAGTSLLRNQPRRSRKDRTPRPIFPSGVEQSQRSFTSWSRAFSFCSMEKFLKAGGIWTAPPWELIAPGTWNFTRNYQEIIFNYRKVSFLFQRIANECPSRSSVRETSNTSTPEWYLTAKDWSGEFLSGKATFLPVRQKIFIEKQHKLIEK